MKTYRFLFLSLLLAITGVVFGQDDYNKFDDAGLRHGKWRGYYEDTKFVRYEGEFKNGKEIGVFKYYDNLKNHSLLATREFNASDSSCFTVFYSGKNKVSEGVLLNKKYHGEWRYFHKNSPSLMTVENYVNGQLNGVRKVYYPDGVLAEEMNYINGLKDGINKKFNKKGLLIEESNYVKGEQHGPITYYNPKGELAIKGQYKNNKATGIWTYYENGKVVKEVSKDRRKKSRKKAAIPQTTSNVKTNK